ncbi:hypothetical protein [Clostridium thailandense]|uniref:hypothetical protein n=1 Tax=Clostridium thailandense TaxID=2794346 RepID=UPI00398A0A37
MNRPIILDNAIERDGDNNKIFEYDYSKDVNVVKMDKQVIPFIDMDTHFNELLTKTKVERECDDEDYSLSELYTKTERHRERDDEEMSFAELQSKTFVERERDDEDDINFN